jgi:hypothetical protein
MAPGHFLSIVATITWKGSTLFLASGSRAEILYAQRNCRKLVETRDFAISQNGA